MRKIIKGGIKMNQLEKTLTSLEVAEMVERRHDQVMRDIDTIVKHLGDHKNVESYFIESTYKNSQNKEYPSYNLTKKGCELYSTRMTGEKGTQFAVAYIERFNKMENHIKEQQKPQSLEVALRAALEHEEQIKTIKSDVTLLKGTMRITSLQQQEIQTGASRVVVKALGGKETPAYKELKGKMFSEFWKEFKNYFKVPRYGDLPTAKFDDAINYLNLWRPNTSMQMEIDSYNSQMAIY